MEYGIFCSDALDYSADEAVEADFSSQEAAEKAIKERYSPEDELHVHAIEEEEDEEDDDDDFDDDDDDDDDDD